MRAALFSSLALAIGASMAQGQILASDDFSYTGAVTANGWAAHSGAGNKMILADGSVATLDQSSGSGEDVNLAFTPQGATDVTFAAMDLNVPSGNPVSPGASGLYFFHLKDAGFAFRARTGLLSPAAGGDYALAINSDSSNLGLGASWASDLSFDTTYRVVVSWDATTGTSELWLNPVNVNSPSITHTGTNMGDLMEGVALRQASDYTGFINVDNVVAGKSFANVLGASAPNSGAPGCDGSTGNCPCSGVGAVNQGCPNSGSANGAKLVGSGNATVTNDSFVFTVTEAAINMPGLILSGTSDLSPGINTVADSVGLLCIGGATLRGKVVFTDAFGNASLPNFLGGPYGMASNVGAGSPTSYQYWFRDPGTSCPPNNTASGDFNFSNLWKVTWAQ